MTRIALTLLSLLGFSLPLTLAAAPAAANSSPTRLTAADLASDLPVRLRYLGTEASQSDRPSFLVRSGSRHDPQRLAEAPSRYRTRSVLRYTKPLGDTGMVLKVKAPLNPRRLIKIELRF